MRVFLAALALALAGCVTAPPAAVPSVPTVPSASVAVATPEPSAPTSAPPLPAPPPIPSPAPAAALPFCPRTPPVTLSGTRFELLCPDGAQLRIDASLTSDDEAAIVAQVREDLVAVQRDFAWTLRSPAVVYVLGTRAAYVATLEQVFGYGAATAEFVADNSVAFFEPSLRIIAVNWDEVRDRRPIAAIRHELTHVVTLEACAPRCDLVPAWFNEGQARLAETTVGAEWRLVRVRYEAASMAATSTLLPLTALWTQAQWNAYGDWLGYYKYQEAARATELLREDIGDDALPRLYERIRAGSDLPTAYAALAGRSFASFTAALESRIRGDLPARGIVATTPGADGTGVSYLVYGFPAEAKITLRIRSHSVDQTQELSVSPQGALFASIDDAYPQGMYTITAASGDAVAAVTVTKRGGRAHRAPAD